MKCYRVIRCTLVPNRNWTSRKRMTAQQATHAGAACASPRVH